MPRWIERPKSLDLISSSPLENLAQSHLLNYSMERSATKVLEWNDSDDAVEDIRKSSRSIVSRMYVEGYDTSLSGYEFVMSMRKHFHSCGEVLHVYIPGYAQSGILNRFALIYLRGEGAEEKALRLSGSCSSRGHKLFVGSYPFHANHLDHELAPMRYADNKEELMISVEGYDTSLPLEHVQSVLFEQLSKCGRIQEVFVFEEEENEGVLSREGCVFAKGIDTVEKMLQLCGCDVKGFENIKVNVVAAPDPDGASVCNLPPGHYPGIVLSPSVMAATARVDPNLPKPPCLGNLLPYPWNCRVDSRTGNSCIWNAETGVQFEVPPSSSEPASTIRYASEDLNLPKPWKALVNSSNGYLYFWNTETNVTQYERPPSSLSLLPQSQEV